MEVKKVVFKKQKFKQFEEEEEGNDEEGEEEMDEEEEEEKPIEKKPFIPVPSAQPKAPLHKAGDIEPALEDVGNGLLRPVTRVWANDKESAVSSDQLTVLMAKKLFEAFASQ